MTELALATARQAAQTHRLSSFELAPVLLLRNTGARSGEERVNPVIYLADGDRHPVFNSAAGSDRNPAWYWNVMAQPEVSIEVGDRRVDVHAQDLRGDERDAKCVTEAQRYTGVAEYPRTTTRRISVIALTPMEPTS